MSQRASDHGGRLSRALEDARVASLSPLGIGFFSALCLVAAALRGFAQLEPDYGFLRWNLFLAWVPLVLAYALSWVARRPITRPASPVLALLWLIFLPNAPYLVTDLVHLHELFSIPNAVVLGLLALAGLLIGVKSVLLVQQAVEDLWGFAAGWRAVHVVAFLMAFGIYLGRVKRWNSWTVIEDPHTLVEALRAAPSEPARLMLAIIATVGFGLAFSIVYRLLAGPAAAARRLEAVPARRGAES